MATLWKPWLRYNILCNDAAGHLPAGSYKDGTFPLPLNLLQSLLQVVDNIYFIFDTNG